MRGQFERQRLEQLVERRVRPPGSRTSADHFGRAVGPEQDEVGGECAPSIGRTRRRARGGRARGRARRRPRSPRARRHRARARARRRMSSAMRRRCVLGPLTMPTGGSAAPAPRLLGHGEPGGGVAHAAADAAVDGDVECPDRARRRRRCVRARASSRTGRCTRRECGSSRRRRWRARSARRARPPPPPRRRTSRRSSASVSHGLRVGAAEHRLGGRGQPELRRRRFAERHQARREQRIACRAAARRRRNWRRRGCRTWSAGRPSASGP